MEKINIAIIGGGPAGIMAAISSSSLGLDVTIFEAKSSLGNKLLLSGKGRCNLTNTAELPDFLKKFNRGAEFLRDAFKIFFHPELIAFFEARELKLEVERQERVFPASGRSFDVLKTLTGELEKNGVKICYGCKAQDLIIRDGKIKGVTFENKETITAQLVIMATGGASYSFTGSDASGIKIAEKAGHKIIPLKPGLVALDIKENFPKLLEGLTLRNIKLEFSSGKTKISSEVGEMLFTATGISGPLVFSNSAKVTDLLGEAKPVTLKIDLKPGLTLEQLDKRLLRDFKSNTQKNVKNTFKGILPLRLIKVFLEAAGIDQFKKCSQVSQKERRCIIQMLKGFQMKISSGRPIEEGMVTRGGISLKEINPRTMQSRLVQGLYFCGEMIDIDADTGGFNLQAAFSTGYLAGRAAGVVLKTKQNYPQ